jgi:hypothetical protein
MKLQIVLMFLFASLLNLHAQKSGFDLVLQDSFPISSHYFGGQLVLNGSLCFFDTDSMLLYRFDENFKIKDSITIAPPNTKKAIRLHPSIVFADTANYWFLSTKKNELFEYDINGRIIKTIKINFKSNGKELSIDDGMYTTGSQFYDKTSKSFFLTVRPKNRLDSETDDYYEKYFAQKYRSNVVIGELSPSGNLIKCFGNYDNIYKDKVFLSHLDDTFFDKYDENAIIYTNQLSDDMTILDLIDGSARRVGERGKYINKAYSELAEIRNREASFFNEYTCLIESPYYASLDVIEDFIIRTYSIAIKDTVSIDQNDTETRVKWLRGEIKGCLLASKTEKLQQNLWLTKPYFVQIYDRKSLSLLFDGPIGHCFPKFIRADGSKLYFYKGISKRFVYEYQLK